MQPPDRVASVGGAVVANVGHPFTFSDVVMENFGNEPIVLDGVSLVQATPGIRIVGLLAAPTPPNAIAGDADYPPPFAFPMRHFKGYVIHPGQITLDKSVLLIMGLLATRNGVSGFRAVEIHYHVGTTQYEWIDPYGWTACAPESKYAKGDHPDCRVTLYDQA